MRAPTRRAICSGLGEFISQLAGRPHADLCNLYGISLRNEGGQTAAYVGREANFDSRRPEEYVAALATDSQRGGPDHPDWHRVPERLKYLRRRGFCHRGGSISVLRGVPRSIESAAAFELERMLGEGHAVGGLLALAPWSDAVREACVIHRRHDGNLCISCGGDGHFARECDVGRCVAGRSSTPVLELAAERTASAVEALADITREHTAQERVAQTARHSAMEAEREAAARARAEERADRRAAQGSREAREAREIAAQPLAQEEAWKSERGPQLTEQDLRPRLMAHAPRPVFANTEEHMEVFGTDATLVVQSFASAEVCRGYKRKNKAWEEAGQILSDKSCGGKAASNWTRNVFPKHVRNAVARGVLEGPEDRYLKMVTVRSGNNPKSYVMKVEDFVKLYTTP